MMDDKAKWDLYFGPVTAVAAEAMRVGFVSCKSCGATVLLDSRDKIDFARLHIKWHEEQEA